MQSVRNNKIDSITTRDQDLHGRKFGGAADGVKPQDYVTLNQLTKMIDSIPFQQGVSGIFPYIKSVDFVGSTVTTGIITVVKGAVISIT